MRAAAYQAATPGIRRGLHAALAEATDRQLDPDRRAWHRAHAVIDTEDVAAELTESAERTQLRGDLAAASAFLERAAQLTPHAGDQGGRLLSAARLRMRLGAFTEASELVSQAERRPLEPEHRAEACLQRALIDLYLDRSPEATAALVSAAADLAPDKARETYLEAFSSAMFLDRLPGRLRQLGTRIRDQVPTPEQPRPVDRLLDALLDQAMLPAERAVPTMRLAVDAFRTTEFASPWWMELICMMAIDLCDAEAMDEVSSRQVELARRQSAFAVLLPQALKFHAIGRMMLGRFDEAAADLEEARAVDEAAGTVNLAFAEFVLAAWRGEADQFQELLAGLHDRIGRDEIVAELYATAVLRNGLGDYSAALKAGLTAQQEQQRGSYVVWSLDSELVEAAARAGRPEDAAVALERIEALARTNPTPWAVASHLLAQALLDPTSASTDSRFREAIDLFAQTEVRAQHARARLLYGEWLRRESRRAEARVELQAAHERLSAMGAGGFAERAARELAATGQRPRRDGVNQLDQLTAQERLIAAKVAGGATSKEVAATLFLSPRTIDAHLRNIYRKLDLTSRRQLRDLSF